VHETCNEQHHDPEDGKDSHAKDVGASTDPCQLEALPLQMKENDDTRHDRAYYFA